jgi:hypothetical protein
MTADTGQLVMLENWLNHRARRTTKAGAQDLRQKGIFVHVYARTAHRRSLDPPEQR